MRIRGADCHGSGHYQAPRGNRLHNGIDICIDKGEIVRALVEGKVSKIGYPYSQAASADEDKKALRYIQITDANGVDIRYFYVKTLLRVGDIVITGDNLGVAQGLEHIYPGITEHFHLEVLIMTNGRKVFIDPVTYIAAHKGVEWVQAV